MEIVVWVLGPLLGWLAYGLAYKAGRKHGYFRGWLDGSRQTLETVSQTVTPESFQTRMTELMEMSRVSQQHLAKNESKWLHWLKGEKD